jgi:hypothetical protein
MVNDELMPHVHIYVDYNVRRVIDDVDHVRPDNVRFKTVFRDMDWTVFHIASGAFEIRPYDAVYSSSAKDADHPSLDKFVSGLTP